MNLLLMLIDQIPFIGALRTQIAPYAIVNAAHILFPGVLLGAILPLDLGIVGAPGFAWTRTVTTPLRRMATGAFVGAALTGVLLFAVRPLDYLDNTAFLLKGAILLAAGANAILSSRIGATPVRRVQAAASLGMWVMVLIAGRWIGFS